MDGRNGHNLHRRPNALDYFAPTRFCPIVVAALVPVADFALQFSRRMRLNSYSGTCASQTGFTQARMHPGLSI
jgi:hypothetical protein